MKKLKIYLDTSVLSHLDSPDTPEKMVDTLGLWEDLRKEKYEIYISGTVLDEINRCYEPKRSFLYHCLTQINYQTIKNNLEIDKIANQIINLEILPQKCYDDCLHIASAVVSTCNYIVSWNFTHLVNIKTINGVRAITNLYGFGSIDIVSPSMLIIKED